MRPSSTACARWRHRGIAVSASWTRRCQWLRAHRRPRWRLPPTRPPGAPLLTPPHRPQPSRFLRSARRLASASSGHGLELRHRARGRAGAARRRGAVRAPAEACCRWPSGRRSERTVSDGGAISYRRTYDLWAASRATPRGRTAAPLHAQANAPRCSGRRSATASPETRTCFERSAIGWGRFCARIAASTSCRSSIPIDVGWARRRGSYLAPLAAGVCGLTRRLVRRAALFLRRRARDVAGLGRSAIAARAVRGDGAI